ncbi:hypothetical protein G6F37_000443 [Rhizopus arrhizus]|nr:hypothetical protein G6F38_002788 [Rhizopus arrhizus]KAG1164276.1 hypothetical protein G6F37_000443 [Rhizopus arrhizus]
MKFGDHLSSRIYPPWHIYYLQYNELKLEMKRRQLDHQWNDTDEAEFIRKLEAELVKVYRFVEKNIKDLNKRCLQIETIVRALMANTAKNTRRYDEEADRLTEILFDCNDMSKFLQLNATGFEKLVKKHDRYTHMRLVPTFKKEMLSEWSLDRLTLQFDVLVVKISELHDICQLHGNPRQTYNYVDQTAFERATAKYWVHPDNITEVKSIILFHLPVHIFNQKKQYEESDMAVSSVYFDNQQLGLYTGRLEREPGAEAIRLRWYGDNEEDVYVERKTHKAAWLEGKSVKDRFRIKQGLVNDYLIGRYTADDLVEDLRMKANGKARSEAVLEENHFVASGIQASIKKKSLQPMCRVFYNRTAFQLPGDQRLRISLDSNLTFIREHGFTQSHWRRKDVGIDYPFRNVADEDILRFPYAILETKLQTHLGQECPAWLTSLIESHLVYEVPRFSKYIHGAATLFKKNIPVAPYWLEEFSKDIRKKPMANIGLSRSQSFKPLVNGHHRQSLLMMYEREMQKPGRNIPKSKSLADLFSVSGSSRRHDRQHLAIETGEMTNSSNAPKDIMSRIWNASTPRLTKSFLKKGNETPLLPRTRSNLVKKIEPKTFFANERTFISWLQFCALLLTVALNLLNYGDLISRGIGATFIVIGAALCIYALIRYQIRSWQLRTNRHIIRYDDIWGPTVLCILLVVALMVNFYLRFSTLSPTTYEDLSTDQ